MKGYAKQALAELQHVFSGRFQPSPPRVERPAYGPEPQRAKGGSSPLLSGKQASCLQRATGKLLCYARAIGSAMLHALSSIARAVAKGAKDTEDAAAQHLMGYACSSPGAQAKLRASEMATQGGSS